jgi:hypothetical protein
MVLQYIRDVLGSKNTFSREYVSLCNEMYLIMRDSSKIDNLVIGNSLTPKRISGSLYSEYQHFQAVREDGVELFQFLVDYSEIFKHSCILTIAPTYPNENFISSIIADADFKARLREKAKTIINYRQLNLERVLTFPIDPSRPSRGSTSGKRRIAA